MFRIFVHRVLGGQSGKREAAWFMWFVVTGMVGFAIFSEFNGTAMPNTNAILVVVWPAVTVGVLTAHGIEHYGGSNLLSNRRITIDGAQGSTPTLDLDAPDDYGPSRPGRGTTGPRIG